MKVLFVCTGNICRSPTAAGVLTHFVREAGLSESIQVESAGTHGYHVGEAPDRRAQEQAKRPGVHPSAPPARRGRKRDFSRLYFFLAVEPGPPPNPPRQCP